ncbi:hypothetical protein G5576_110813 [Homo sapiens]|uniref:Uncharacterized protein n=1 Tax=Homo sapiens TaxID=9606 RepID=F8WDY8_HUMAN|nr:hypothetical protein KI723_060762 [Homo sapiens]KAI4018266.1 hypothetical protein G5576_110813 [Homo sapiens]
MSVQNSGWPHQEDSPKPQDPGPPANSDSDSGHLPGEDPEDTHAQEFLSLHLLRTWGFDFKLIHMSIHYLS